jgi:hypothetical protein
LRLQFMPTSKTLLVFAAAFVLLLAKAHAHDPYQGWTSADLRTDGTMVITLTIGQGAARNLLEPKTEVYFTDDNFAQYHAPFKTQAVSLFTVTSNGTVLKPTTGDALLTDEADVTFTVTYPRPVPGALQIQANYLRKMEGGHVDTIEVVEGTKASYGMADLDAEHPAIDLNLPATLPATRFAPVAPVANPPKGASSSYGFPPGTPFPASTPASSPPATTITPAPSAPTATSQTLPIPVANTTTRSATPASVASPPASVSPIVPAAAPRRLNQVISFFSHHGIAALAFVVLIGFVAICLRR